MMAQYVLLAIFIIGSTLFLMLTYSPLATASIDFGLQLTSYNGDSNKADDTCCDPNQDGLFVCDSLCDPGFHICLDDGSLTCPFFDETTGLIEEDVQDIDFQTDSLGLLPNPIQVTIDKWPDLGLRINITAEDYDESPEKEKIDNYLLILADIPSLTVPARLRGLDRPLRTQLIFEYVAFCSDGFEGLDCQTNTDECLSDPCQNGATCNDLINGYNCSCTSSFTGTLCDAEVDECELQPCQNGGTCYDFRNDFNCSCSPGYEGSYCEQDIDECTSNPCQNGATCTDYLDGFTCTCSPGYEGSYCEHEIDECTCNPCQNGATCTDYLDGFNCTCSPGYGGSYCEQDIDECTSNPCQNGATCTDYLDGFNCTCSPGYEGCYCESIVNACLNFPCLNGASCSDLSPGFKCTCLPGYTDEYCSSDIDECDIENACPGNSICENTLGSFACLCFEGYEGGRCDIITDPCVSSPCERGTCDKLSSDAYRCLCEDGFLGVNCEVMNPCTSTPCLNGGECESDDAGQWACKCPKGFIGKLCELDSESYSYSLFIYGSSVDREYFVRDMEALFSDVYGENVTVLIIETSNYYTPDTGEVITGVTFVVFVNGTLLTSDEISAVLNAVPEEDLNNRESFEFYFGEVIEDKPQQRWLAEYWYVLIIAVVVGIFLLLSTTMAVAHLVVKRSFRKIQYENNRKMLDEAEKQTRISDDMRYTREAWDAHSQGLRNSQHFAEEHIYRTNPVYLAHDYESVLDDSSDNYP